jgi:hypothetical protein
MGKPKYQKRKRRSVEKIDGEELTTYIKSVLDTLSKVNSENFRLEYPVEFELSIINTKKKGGGIKIFVVDAHKKTEKEAISKIKFSFTHQLL